MPGEHRSGLESYNLSPEMDGLIKEFENLQTRYDAVIKDLAQKHTGAEQDELLDEMEELHAKMQENERQKEAQRQKEVGN